MPTIQVPDFNFAAFYYPEILEATIQFLRREVPELTDEDATEPAIQLLRAFALGGHLNNVNLDAVANEVFLPTAKLRASVKSLLQLIDFPLSPATPATADVLYQLTRRFAVLTTVAPARSLFATRAAGSVQGIEYEVAVAVTTIRTDQVDRVYAWDGAAFTDHSAEAQSAAGSFTPAWGAAPSVGDILYIGHANVLWDDVRVVIATPAAQITTGVWEYFDGSWEQGAPTSVVNNGNGTLTFNVNAILGTSNRAGSRLRVRSLRTGGFQYLVSTWDGTNNLITTTAAADETGEAGGLLGQSSPSTTTTDYIVGGEWREVSGLSDGSSLLTAAAGERTVAFTVPQSVTQNWRRTSVGTGALAYTAYWLRFRVITVGGAPTSPSITQIRIDAGRQYQVVSAVQGRTRDDNPLASSTGLADQFYALRNFPVIDDANLRVYVTEAGVEREYARVENFLNSTSVDRHFTAAFDDDGVATITFGNGVSGRIPPAGADNIRATYRTMEDVDGNVGAGAIEVNRSGVSFITGIRNPRAAAGYAIRRGGSDVDLARVKVEGPASLRTGRRFVSMGDIEAEAVRFVAADGSRPFARALAIEEAFGAKTVEVIVVGAGGAAVPASLLTEFQDYLNGVSTSARGRIVLNQRATVNNHAPRVIAVTATVDGGSLAAIQTALTALLNPLAVLSTGAFVWDFNGTVPRARLIQEIMNTTPAPRNVTLTVPAADVALLLRELPAVGALSIVVNP